MLRTPDGTPGRHRSQQALTELIEALDRRLPGPQGPAEQQTAADSARLRAWAGASIRSLRRTALQRETAETGRALEVMADDGAPSRRCVDSGELA